MTPVEYLLIGLVLGIVLTTLLCIRKGKKSCPESGQNIEGEKTQ